MVHQYKNNGYNIVLDVCSGSVHVVDDLVYDMISMYEDSSKDEIATAIFERYGDMYSREDIEEAYSDIEELKSTGQLFTEDVYKDVIIDFKKRQTVVKALCLHIAHDCNLACKYCFADEGEYHGQKRELMSLEVGKKAIDFLIENSDNRVNLEVDFFGGEPLMNFDVVKEIVAYGRAREKEAGKNFRFTLTTNGILLNDEVME
ncbi:MAG: 4Fe-4S cluster-binding domain-containing protein, partial [Lachnospiraceae bacterium]|nr:4Fe-4S cluster-binding domain-containing protein [Lachnospiraceae bacterium]